MAESEMVGLIDTYTFQTIEIGLPNGGDLIRPESYTPQLMKAITDRYRIALRNGRYAVLVPNVE